MTALGFLDIAMIVGMAVLASLSKRLGAALKIAPFYKLYTLSIVLIAVSAFADSASMNTDVVAVPFVITTAARVAAGLIALLTTYRYWYWLSAEFNS